MSDAASNAFAAVYPPEFAAHLARAWQAQEDVPGLPSTAFLESFIDTLYQASFLKEEGEPILCRAILSEPQEWKQGEGPPAGFHVLRFASPRPFTTQEIRKLAPSASYYRTLLGVNCCSESGPQVWGIIATGARWVNRVDGGRFFGAPLPAHLVVHILGPGRLLTACGYQRLLELVGGRVQRTGFDPFKSKWLELRFRHVRTWLLERFSKMQIEGAEVGETFVRLMTQNVARRIFSLVRRRHHGGMMISLPADFPRSGCENHWLRIRTCFESAASTRRFSELMLQLMGRMSIVGHTRGLKCVTWEDYQEMEDFILSEIDESFIELSNLYADLMNVDGALVVSENFELIGFGAEVIAENPVRQVYRALDVEANETLMEQADNSGTRHRAAYRIVAAVQNCLAVVISQDGSISFVANRNGQVVYWPYLP